ncbi:MULTISPECIES: SCO family protein [unclassified Campylobacter]|uniref:SCO family protein n=1 Tax=unclassified Campylobacter TaxID=2593542 RepID=UPI001237C75B|nr:MULTISPECIES: SCO family protein [unclassified Campylobacter]KAA6224731.1 SCO family protein [Campylobacter sp. LR185c]KAA6225728.1 SCO family protein [Campylobacter sp. LR286c]KAA6225849.1 SCO family protein [Campylobacter sp. LR196d]KAA6229701.1 SCO family protein [Campylobacter sp. LR291e]KAA6230053.1 SCO family protein [Campylobacter sp. LR264d]
MKKILIALIVFLCVIMTFFYFKDTNKYDFVLNSEFGENTTLSTFKGKKLIIYFGYTFCPDVCPATLVVLAQELEKLENKDAYLLFVSLDIERDKDIKKTNEWLRYFYPNSTSLIASNEKTLQKIANNYGVKYHKVDLHDSFMQYSVAHSNALYFIDENGNFWGDITNLDPEELQDTLKKFLQG